MLGRKQELNLQFLQITDGILMVVAFWLAHAFRFLGGDWALFGNKPIGPFADFEWLLFVILPFGPILLEVQGFYQNPMLKDAGKSMAQIVRGFFWLGLVIAGCSYFLKLAVPSRAVMPLFAFFSFIVLLSRDRWTQAELPQPGAAGASEGKRHPGGDAGGYLSIEALFTAEQVMEMAIVDEIDIETRPTNDLTEALHEHSVSRVIFASGQSHMNRLQEAIAACEIEGVEAWVVADFIRTSIARPDFDVFGNSVLVFRTTPDLSWALLVKAFIDRVGAFLGLLLASWLFAIIASGIKLTSPGPAIFRQKRAGKHGKPFTMYKFRSMRTDAEMQHAELLAFNQMEGPVFKIEHDPRITKFGRFLRRTSLDELPQLINVLKGEMSLVGPRPLPIYEVEKFSSPSQRRRLSMKPGLTCLWQISGRNQIKSFNEWVTLDLRYIDQWSLWLDFSILLRTIPVVLFGLGAR